MALLGELVTAEHEAVGRVHFAAADVAPVAGLTHGYYRYPARFSPVFARSAIEEFSSPGDTVLDPFVGGGTSALEAMVAGRRFFGLDISELATFVASVKTSPIPDESLDVLISTGISWAKSLRVGRSSEVEGRQYMRNMHKADSWRIRNIVDCALRTLPDVPPDQQDFLRCALLRAGQLALDGRRSISTVAEFRSAAVNAIEQMATGMRELNNHLNSVENVFEPTLSTGDARSEAAWTKGCASSQKARLVITSPPYPGVHVLYHRWAIRGRRETPLPFEIAGRNDGAGLSHYTLGDRKSHGAGAYFERITSIYENVRKACADDAWVVQMVGFSDPSSQLPQYMNAMSAAGFAQVETREGLGDFWRDVPGRKWWAEYRENTRSTSREVVLIHRPLPAGA